MSHRSEKPWGSRRYLNANGRRALGSIEQAVRTPSEKSRPATKLPPRSAGRRRYTSASLPEFDYLPSLSDENVGDVLQYLLAMVDAVEDHYADPLRRLRQRQYEQLRADLAQDQYDWVDGADEDFEF